MSEVCRFASVLYARLHDRNASCAWEAVAHRCELFRIYFLNYIHITGRVSGNVRLKIRTYYMSFFLFGLGCTEDGYGSSTSVWDFEGALRFDLEATGNDGMGMIETGGYGNATFENCVYLLCFT